jgi:hypothetical protein
MNKHRQAFAEADVRRRRCADWLRTLMTQGHPKPATKAELCAWARANLDVNKSNFDEAWIMAIEETGRHDWYEPRPRRRVKVQ